jgi:hypothetical protein
LSCTLGPADECPIPIAEDRFLEALHFMTQLGEDYHDPRKFRFNLNAALAALRAASELLVKEMQTHDQVTEWRRLKDEYRADPDLASVKHGRNVTLHQTAIYNGSSVLIGLYRWRRHKLTVGTDIHHDETTAQVLARWLVTPFAKMLLDEEHSAIGEEYGVWRQYFVKELSDKDDALKAMWKAVIRTNDFLSSAHHICGFKTFEVPAEELLSPETLSEISILLESDVDPTLHEKWGW